MEKLTDDSARAVINSWAAHNHGLAVEIEKRAARHAAENDGSAIHTLNWFASDFETWLKSTLDSDQESVSELVKDLTRYCPPYCFLTAWRHLHDVIEAARGSDRNYINERKWEALSRAVLEQWTSLVQLWNKYYNQTQKEAANARYKGLLEDLILMDFSENRVSSHKIAGIADYVSICNEVVAIMEEQLAKNKKYRLRPVHLYTMVATLEEYRQLPTGHRQALTSYLCEQRGISVSRTYVPDRTRQKNPNSDEPTDDITLAVEATTEALVALKLVTFDDTFRTPQLIPTKRKRTI